MVSVSLGSLQIISLHVLYLIIFLSQYFLCKYKLIEYRGQDSISFFTEPLTVAGAWQKRNTNFLMILPCQQCFMCFLKVILHKIELLQNSCFVFKNAKPQRRVKNSVLNFIFSCRVSEKSIYIKYCHRIRITNVFL